MKKLVLMLMIALSVNAADIIAITPDLTFNYFFSIFLYLMLGLVAFFGVITFLM